VRILGSAVALVLMTTAAGAADLMSAGVVEVAATDDVVSWSGCYIGASLGYAAETTATVLAAGLYDGGSHIAEGFTLGGRAGCDVQLGEMVLGVVGTIELTDLSGSNAFYPFGPLVPEYTTTETSAIATIKGRIGYLVDPALLLYGTGGLALIHNRHTDYDTTPVMSFNGSVEDTRVGYVVGLGAEYAVADGWSVFAEYNYVDFGQKDLTLVDGVIYPGNWVNRYDNTAHAFAVGLNFRF
jgi:outer membrane immunogenic protein